MAGKSNARCIVIGVLALVASGCVSTQGTQTTMRVRRAKKRAVTPVAQPKRKRRKKAFERICVTDDLQGCDELAERKKRAEAVAKQVREHIAQYEPLVAKLRIALETPARTPDARVKAKIKLVSGKLNYDGPHAVQLAVQVVYQDGAVRHPRTDDIQDILDEILRLNKELENENLFYQEAFDQVRGQVVKLALTIEKERVVHIPTQFTKILTDKPLPVGSVAYALVFSEPGLKYRIIKEWREAMVPAFMLSKEGRGVKIWQSVATTKMYKRDHAVRGAEVCASLRAEVRLLPAGSPRRKWAVSAMRGGGR